MKKKIIIAFGCVFGLVLLAIVLIPVFVDANKFRPQIEKIVEENLNADLELGQLGLSLWGGLHIGIEHLNLSEKDSQGKRRIFSMKDVRLEIPILSVFSGRPEADSRRSRPPDPSG